MKLQFWSIIKNSSEDGNRSVRAIRKEAPIVPFRGFAADYVRKMVPGSCIDKHKNEQAYFVLFVKAWLNCY